MTPIEPPFGDIWDGLKEGRVIPFLGAGASLVGRDPAHPWQSTDSLFLPNGSELAHYIAERAGFPAQDPHDSDDLGKGVFVRGRRLGAPDVAPAAPDGPQ